MGPSGFNGKVCCLGSQWAPKSLIICLSHDCHSQHAGTGQPCFCHTQASEILHARCFGYWAGRHGSSGNTGGYQSTHLRWAPIPAKPSLVHVRKHPSSTCSVSHMRRRAGGIHSNTAGEGVEQQHANTEHRENRRSRTEKRKLEGELPDFFLPSSPLS